MNLAREDRAVNLALKYSIVKEELIRLGYEAEIRWQHGLCADKITETDFLREAAWVILCSGMRESVVRARFEQISASFFHWDSAEVISANHELCVKTALQFFAHHMKLRAIVEIARCVQAEGFAPIWASIRREGVQYIRRFPFMGEVTSCHLAKNLGLDIIKPDRHLTRLAAAAGYATPNELCADIARLTCDKLPVVDLVLWRFATLVPEYESLFAATQRQ